MMVFDDSYLTESRCFACWWCHAREQSRVRQDIQISPSFSPKYVPFLHSVPFASTRFHLVLNPPCLLRTRAYSRRASSTTCSQWSSIISCASTHQWRCSYSQWQSPSYSIHSGTDLLSRTSAHRGIYSGTDKCPPRPNPCLQAPVSWSSCSGPIATSNARSESGYSGT